MNLEDVADRLEAVRRKLALLDARLDSMGAELRELAARMAERRTAR